MLITFEDRPTDSPFIERVWRSRSERAGVFTSIAACHWEMVVTRLHGQTSLTVRGPETVATAADLPAEGEWFAIRFKLGTFMPELRPGFLRDLNSVTLPAATQRSFRLHGASWEYPDFDNAEIFVRRLVRAGLILVDPTVAGVLRNEPPALSARSLERKFRQVTGLTLGTIRQIERARHATRLLRSGRPLLDAGYDAGYYDQAHFTRSLKRFIGQTPAQVIAAQQQLSFLYNPQPASF
ncbi:MAG TPA: helix-turn-helix domain-containing protein [Opitutaceae bacterium]